MGALQQWNEPWVFGAPDGAFREFFAEQGLETGELLPVGGQESIQRYLTRPDGTLHPYLVERQRQPMPEVTEEQRAAAMAVAAKTGAAWYTLAELIVPGGKT
jgi:hypothetical protein